jgi:glucose-6-phosphate-specific signal transduction histidine kinase
MERRPGLTSLPPVALESVVGLLVPPLAREHVLGDLAERYVSPGRYLLDALRTVPAVVISQIRRTSYFVLWPMVGLLLAFAFSRGTEGWWPRAVIAAVITLLAFMFRDAYRVPDLEHPRRKGLVDIAIVAAAVLAVESGLMLWHPAWSMTLKGLSGGAWALALLYFLRLQNPTGRVPHSA